MAQRRCHREGRNRVLNSRIGPSLWDQVGLTRLLADGLRGHHHRSCRSKWRGEVNLAAIGGGTLPPVVGAVSLFGERVNPNSTCYLCRMGSCRSTSAALLRSPGR